MSDSNVDLTSNHDENGKFAKGNTAAKGRQPGSKNWSTVFNEAIKTIADANGKTPEEMERMLQEVGISRALKGDHRYWNEIQKRLYGDVRKEVHVTTEDEPSERIKELAEILNED